ncbi:MAG: WD40/YVTN/BNR-like repeat-containing protein [Bacteroidales bacterium]
MKLTKILKRTLITVLLFHTVSTNYAQWINVYQDSTLIEVSDLYFLNKDTGFVCGTISHGVGFVMKTSDGGVNWQITYTNLVCSAIDFVNDSVGFTGGQDGGIYKTNDRGETWNYFSNVQAFSDFEDLKFVNDSVGFVKNYSSAIYKTIDGGLTWSVVSDKIGSHFDDRKNNSIHFFTDSIGFVVGIGKIYKTVDQGSSWHKKNVDSKKYYRALCMINEFEGFAVGNKGVLFHTVDGGESWYTDSISNQDLRDIVFISDSVGFIVGGGFNYFNDTTGIVLRTTNKGYTWETIKLSDSRLNSFQYVDSVAYATGNYGNIFKNDNYSDLLEIQNHLSDRVKKELLIWPNPVRGIINFKIPDQKDVELELRDINGVLYKSEWVNLRKIFKKSSKIYDDSKGFVFESINGRKAMVYS